MNRQEIIAQANAHDCRFKYKIDPQSRSEVYCCDLLYIEAQQGHISPGRLAAIYRQVEPYGLCSTACIVGRMGHEACYDSPKRVWHGSSRRGKR